MPFIFRAVQAQDFITYHKNTRTVVAWLLQALIWLLEPSEESGQYYGLPLTQSSAKRTNTHHTVQLVAGQGRWL